MEAVIRVLAAIVVFVVFMTTLYFILVGIAKADSAKPLSDEVCKKGVLYYQDQEGRLMPALKLDWSLHSCGATLSTVKFNYASYVF